MIRLFWTQWKKLFSSPIFYCSVLAVAALCACSEVSLSEEKEVIIGCIAEYSSKQMLQDTSFNSFQILTAGLDGYWLQLFLPVIAVIGAINVYTDEAISKEKRWVIFHVGKTKYYIGNILFLLSAGAVIALFGYILFGIFVNICFPNIFAYGPEQTQEYLDWTFQHCTLQGRIYEAYGMGAVYLVKGLSFAGYGAVISTASAVIVSFVKNKYLVTCIPFFFYDVLRQISNVLIGKGARVDNFEDYDNIAELVSPNSMLAVLTSPWHAKRLLFFNIGVVCIGAVISFFLMRVGVDKGE